MARDLESVAIAATATMEYGNLASNVIGPGSRPAMAFGIEARARTEREEPLRFIARPNMPLDPIRP